MDNSEQALIGWKKIAHMFNCSERKMQSLREELVNSGAIFYMKLGRPPRKRVCAFPSVLRNWSILKSSKREMI
jgi:hypothetical protein